MTMQTLKSDRNKIDVIRYRRRTGTARGEVQMEGRGGEIKRTFVPFEWWTSVRNLSNDDIVVVVVIVLLLYGFYLILMFFCLLFCLFVCPSVREMYYSYCVLAELWLLAAKSSCVTFLTMCWTCKVVSWSIHFILSLVGRFICSSVCLSCFFFWLQFPEIN